MKTRNLFILSMVMFAFLPLAKGQSFTTMGTDFWFSFMEGRIEASMSVTVTGIRACSGTVSNPHTGWSQSFNVPANGSVIITIDTSISYNLISNHISNKGLHLVTTDTVSVYASNFLRSSFDVTYVLPTPALKDEYIVQTFETWRTDNRSEILIIATEDSTTVNIFPEASTINSSATGNFTVTLNAGQCYFMKCGEIGDYSGTRIKSDGCKPIAVFNGHVCAHIPVPTGSYCDHLFEQAIPISYWGKRFVATMSSRHNGDYVKVTSSRDNCVVWVNGTQVAVLDAGESYNRTMSNTQTSCYIETSQPAAVYSYMLSKNVAGPDGDPSMTLVAPIEQQLKDVVFVCYNNYNQLTSYHYINVVAQTTDVSQIYLDGTSIWNSFNTVPGNPDYSFARIQTNSGTHRLSSTGTNGFVANAYGVGENESYGYSVGFSTRALDNGIVVNGNEIASGDTVTICEGDSVKCYVRNLDSISIEGWFRNGTLVTYDDTLRFICFGTETYRYSTIYNNTDICNPEIDTLFFVLRILESQTTSFDTSICDDALIWYGQTCDSTGTYRHTLTAANGCDSTITLHLNLKQPTCSETQSADCDSIVINGTTYYQDGSIPIDTLTGSNGCDSIVIVNFTVNHSKTNTQTIDIQYGDTIRWIDGRYYSDTNAHPEVRLLTVDGCDSIVRLSFNVHYPPPPPPIDSAAIWVPNVFTPDENSNQVFRVFCNDLTEVHVTIYNRWGDFVTEFDGLSQYWDGTKDGKPCKSESYVYIIEYRKKAMPKIKQRKIGSVLLLR